MSLTALEQKSHHVLKCDQTNIYDPEVFSDSIIKIATVRKLNYNKILAVAGLTRAMQAVHGK